MPQSTSFLVDRFQERCDEALDLAQTVEATTTFLHTRRLYVYEAAYLLAFSAWETFLEQVLLRFMCGYQNSLGTPTSTGTWPRPATLAAAHATLLTIGPRPQPFLLWHNPQGVVQRSRLCFLNGPHEAVLSTVLVEVTDLAAVRHHVAHRTDDTKTKFQDAALRMSGTVVLGGRAGRFLRSSTQDPVTAEQMTWLERACLDLSRYARQIAG